MHVEIIVGLVEVIIRHELSVNLNCVLSQIEIATVDDTYNKIVFCRLLG